MLAIIIKITVRICNITPDVITAVKYGAADYA